MTFDLRHAIMGISFFFSIALCLRAVCADGQGEGGEWGARTGHLLHLAWAFLDRSRNPPHTLHFTLSSHSSYVYKRVRAALNVYTDGVLSLSI